MRNNRMRSQILESLAQLRTLHRGSGDIEQRIEQLEQQGTNEMTNETAVHPCPANGATLLPFVCNNDEKTMTLTGYNLRIQADAATDTYGNLIIGSGHTLEAVAGNHARESLVVGQSNNVEGKGSVALGGSGCTANNGGVTIGGKDLTAGVSKTEESVVSKSVGAVAVGGEGNMAKQIGSVVVGGKSNQAIFMDSIVAGKTGISDTARLFTVIDGQVRTTA